MLESAYFTSKSDHLLSQLQLRECWEGVIIANTGVRGLLEAEEVPDGTSTLVEILVCSPLRCGRELLPGRGLGGGERVAGGLFDRSHIVLTLIFLWLLDERFVVVKIR